MTRTYNLYGSVYCAAKSYMFLNLYLYFILFHDVSVFIFSRAK